MKKVFLAMMALILAMVCAAAAAEHHFDAVTAQDGTVWDLFVITKLNFGEDHQVTSVTGHFERIVMDGDSSETAPESETTFALAKDFRALMAAEPNIFDQTVTVTDLYRWYANTYLGGDEELEGREMVFQCDLPDDEKIDGTYDFGFLTTKIELNSQNEIMYMEQVYVPWA